MNRVVIGLAIIGYTLLFTGCGSDLPETIPVSGRLTFNGGDMPGTGMISFTPLEVAEGFSMRPGRATFDENGQFKATSWEPDDGLVPGKYFLRIECWEVVPMMDEPGKSYIPHQYNNRETSPLELLIINPDSNAIELGELNIESP